MKRKFKTDDYVVYDRMTNKSQCLNCGKFLCGKRNANIKRHYRTIHGLNFHKFGTEDNESFDGNESSRSDTEFILPQHSVDVEEPIVASITDPIKIEEPTQPTPTTPFVVITEKKEVQNVGVPQTDSVQSLLIELKTEIIALKNEVSGLKNEIKELKEGNTKNITKLAQEIISVKLQNRKHHVDPSTIDKFSEMQNLPFAAIEDLTKFDDEIQQNDDKLKQFKQFIAKTGGEGYKVFIRAAIRKVFTDELAAAYAWKGTSTKPSAEKCYVVTIIKDICYAKFNTTDKDMNTVLHMHFLHAKDRILKRKRVE